MAKISAINNNLKRLKMIEGKRQTRCALKAEFKSQDTSFERRMELVHKMAEMPRNSSRVRHRNRCALSGRPRGFHNKFQMSRIGLRELASSGQLPGVVKSSW